MNKCPKCHATRDDDIIDCPCQEPVASVPASGSVKRTLSRAATSTIELSYNGDYPGYPVVRVNGRWLTDEESAFLMRLFPRSNADEGRHGLRKFFDYCGAKMIPGSVEHYPFEGMLTISISQNDERSQPEEAHD